jgi:hypothetical protein
MSSAKMVAQKPGGNFSPLSFSGHKAASDCAAVGLPCANAEELLAYQAPTIASINHRILYPASLMALYLSDLTRRARQSKMLWGHLAYQPMSLRHHGRS